MAEIHPRIPITRADTEVAGRYFSVRTSHYRPDLIVLASSGELDLLTAPVLDRALCAAEGEAPAVVVDLSGVAFLAVAGARVLQHAAERVGHTRCQSLGIVAGNRHQQRVLKLTGLAESTPTYRCLADALPSVGAHHDQ